MGPIPQNVLDSYRLGFKHAQRLLDLPDEFDMVTPWGRYLGRRISRGKNKRIRLGWECRDHLKVGDVLRVIKVDDRLVHLEIVR